VRDCSQKAWFRAALEKFEGNFKSAALGCYGQQFDRCLEAATFLNQVFETCVAAIPLSQVTLATVNTVQRWKQLPTEELNLIYALRNYDNHAGQKPPRDVTKFRSLPNAKMREQLLRGAKQLASVVEITCLPNVVDHLLDPGNPPDPAKPL
jgi:hypothetical protein